MKVIRPLRVFLCHSSSDKPAVRELYQKLRSEDWIDPWLDEEELYPGEDWNMEIEKAVEGADAIIVCLTNNSITKEGYIQRELRIVLDFADFKPEGALYIMPVRLEECEPPRRLRMWQYADYFEGQRERAFERLLVSLRRRANSLHLPIETPILPVLQISEESSTQNIVKELEAGQEIKNVEINPPLIDEAATQLVPEQIDGQTIVTDSESQEEIKEKTDNIALPEPITIQDSQEPAQILSADHQDPEKVNLETDSLIAKGVDHEHLTIKAETKRKERTKPQPVASKKPTKEKHDSGKTNAERRKAKEEPKKIKPQQAVLQKYPEDKSILKKREEVKRIRPSQIPTEHKLRRDQFSHRKTIAQQNVDVAIGAKQIAPSVTMYHKVLRLFEWANKKKSAAYNSKTRLHPRALVILCIVLSWLIGGTISTILITSIIMSRDKLGELFDVSIIAGGLLGGLIIGILTATALWIEQIITHRISILWITSGWGIAWATLFAVIVRVYAGSADNQLSVDNQIDLIIVVMTLSAFGVIIGSTASFSLWRENLLANWESVFTVALSWFASIFIGPIVGILIILSINYLIDRIVNLESSLMYFYLIGSLTMVGCMGGVIMIWQIRKDRNSNKEHPLNSRRIVLVVRNQSDELLAEISRIQGVFNLEVMSDGSIEFDCFGKQEIRPRVAKAVIDAGFDLIKMHAIGLNHKHKLYIASA